MHNLASLVLHLHLLGGVALEGLAADLGNDIVGDLILEHLGLVAFALPQGLHLVHQLNRPACTCTGGCLVAACHNALDRAVLVQGVDGHQGHDGGAVGVCDDALVLLGVLGIDLGDDQGYIGVQPEGAGVVHEYRPRLYDGRCKPLGNVVFRRTQDNVHALEGFIAGQLHRELPALPIDLLPHGPL